jgi:hypothetical protein
LPGLLDGLLPPHPGIKAIRWYLPQFTRKPGAHLHKLVELPGLAGYGHVLPPARQLRH